MDDWARLEIVCARKGTVGSNPTLSAKLHSRAAPSECLIGLGAEPVLEQEPATTEANRPTKKETSMETLIENFWLVFLAIVYGVVVSARDVWKWWRRKARRRAEKLAREEPGQARPGQLGEKSGS